MRTIIGNLSDPGRLLAGLVVNVKPAADRNELALEVAEFVAGAVGNHDLRPEEREAPMERQDRRPRFALADDDRRGHQLLVEVHLSEFRFTEFFQRVSRVRGKGLPFHTGGVNGLFGDGSVRFIKQTLPIRTLASLVSRNGNEVYASESN